MKIGLVVSLALWLVLAACAPMSTPTASTTRTPTLIPTATPTATPISTATPIPPLKMVDACGVTAQTGSLTSLGYRFTIQLSLGEERAFCITTERDTSIPAEFAGGNATIIGNIPDPEQLLDQDGKKTEYLGVKDFAFTWRKSDGSTLVLPALYPRRLSRDGKIEVAPVLIWKGGTDKRLSAGWELDLVDRLSTKVILAIPNPFVSIGKNQSLRLQSSRRTDSGNIPARYEIVDSADKRALANASNQPIGIPITLSSTFETDATIKSQFISVNGQDIQWAIGPVGTLKIVSILSQIPIEMFLDSKGQPLIPMGFVGYTFAWADRAGDTIAVPTVYPPMYNGVSVAPVFLCPQCTDSKNLTQWQVWLVNVKNGSPVQVIEHPFISLKRDETLVSNPDSGHLEIARQTGLGLSLTGQRVGLALPTTYICDPALGTTFDAIEDICFYGFDETDLLRFRRILDWLKKMTPPWYQYVMDQRPFDIYYEPTLQRQNWYGSAGGVNVPGVRGHVSFAERPPNYPMDNLYYTVTLIHEIAHVQDRKADNFENLTGSASCRALERSAVLTERAFLTYLVDAKIDGVNRNELFWYMASDAEILARDTFDWNPACR